MAFSGELVKKYLRKYPKKNPTELSNIIYEENKDKFTSAESLRSIVRYYKGKHGETNFKKLSTSEFIEEHKDVMKKIPNVLLIDIETSPNVSYHWNFWKQNIHHTHIIYPWIMISWAAKWLYESKTFGDVLTIEETRQHDDKRICESFLKVFNDADIIIGHNLKKFDDKRSKTRFFINKLNPPSPYQMIDTLEQLRKEFVMPSNRLDYLLSALHDDSKLPTEFALWPKCLNWFGQFSKKVQQKSLDYMFKYNKKDVYGLEEIYLDIRAWIKNHPNMGIYQESEENVCYKCGSPDLIPEGEYVTPLNRYHAMRCQSCGAIGGRERKTAQSKKQNDALISPIAR